MASVSRTSQLAKVFKVLKKHYQPVSVDSNRPVLEQLLLACCLEDAHYPAAEDAFAAVVRTFFDWNEVRVTTISELAEVMSGLPAPRKAANRFKRVLQSVFEDTYAFDLEESRKKNLGPTVQWLKELDGSTEFIVSYVVQAALEGHSIPVDGGSVQALHVADLVSDKDLAKGVVPGLNRAVAKSKGVEFGSLLHQFGADFTANPYAPAVRKILLQINPDCKDRLPKRRTKKAAKASEDAASASPKPEATKSKKDSSPKKNVAAKAKPASTKKDAGKKAQFSKEESTSAKKPSAVDKKKSASAGLAKRKPR